MKLLVAEDDYQISKMLKVVLERNKYTVYVTDNGVDALSHGLSNIYDGIILDIMMPEKDGLEVLKELRANNINTPVILLTARGELNDRVTGLEAGADDYLPKPFAITELLARIKSLMRRRDSYTADVITIGNLSLNCNTYQLSTSKGSIKIGNKEFQIIEYFMRNPQKIFSTENLMQRFWGWDSDAEINVVWTNITNLRRKLSKLESTVEIKSIRGVGYRLEET